MVLWLMILHLTFGDASSVVQVGPFNSEAACVAAGKKTVSRFGYTATLRVRA